MSTSSSEAYYATCANLIGTFWYVVFVFANILCLYLYLLIICVCSYFVSAGYYATCANLIGKFRFKEVWLIQLKLRGCCPILSGNSYKPRIPEGYSDQDEILLKLVF